jgi:hypothetical protein
MRKDEAARALTSHEGAVVQARLEVKTPPRPVLDEFIALRIAICHAMRAACISLPRVHVVGCKVRMSVCSNHSVSFQAVGVQQLHVDCCTSLFCFATLIAVESQGA